MGEVEEWAEADSLSEDRLGYLAELLMDSVALPPLGNVQAYLLDQSLTDSMVGGSLTEAISANSEGIPAGYLVIHDVSTPNYLLDSFPDNINEDSWRYNDVETVWNVQRAHVFIGRTGRSWSPVDLGTPWRATKFELREVEAEISRGLFLHAELVQPRRSDPDRKKGNDILAPDPGFTCAQYDRLSLIYLCASIRAGEWLVPGFHAVLDEGIAGAHDDPQNFELELFGEALEALLWEIGQFSEDLLD